MPYGVYARNIPRIYEAEIYARTLPNRLRNTCPFASRNTYLRIEEPGSRFPRDIAFREALRGLVDSSSGFLRWFRDSWQSLQETHLHLYDFRRCSSSFASRRLCDGRAVKIEMAHDHKLGKMGKKKRMCKVVSLRGHVRHVIVFMSLLNSTRD